MKSSYQKSILPGGLCVVSERVPHVRSVSIGVWIRVGSRDESPASNGIFHFLEHMLFKGSRRRSARQIAESLESVGGSLNGFTSREQTCYQARILDEHVPLALDVLSDLVLDPRLDPQEVGREKQVVADEIRDLMDSPSDYVDERLAALVWRDHPMGRPISGTLDTLSGFTPRQLRYRLRKWYRPDNIVVAAAGHLHHQRFADDVERFFHFRSEKPVSFKRRSDFSESGEVEVLPRKGLQLHLSVGAPAYPYGHPNKYALLLLNTILGEGMSSRLFQNLRERQGIAYAVHSFLGLTSDTGLIGCYLATEPAKGKRALAMMVRELDDLRKDGLRKEELNHGKAQLKGHLMLGLESMSARMMRLAQQEIHLGRSVSLDETLACIEAVGNDEVLQAAGQLLARDRLSLAVIGPVRKNQFQRSDLLERR
jgi:predicted Zn-dependent peptidase